MARRPLVAGNWKMNGLQASAGELEKIIAGAQTLDHVDLMVCPPATLVAAFAAAARGTRVVIGGQDCHALPEGPYTGDIAAEMLRDAGAQAVIVGHSERRRLHGETDATVHAKVLAARRAGLIPILCIGETGAERDAGRTRAVVQAQLEGSLPEEGVDDFVIAYEPVWAIGSGVTPSEADIHDIHGFIRGRLLAHAATGAATRILYGGSVKPANAKQLLSIENVDGALVGGASLHAKEFLPIAEVYR